MYRRKARITPDVILQDFNNLCHSIHDAFPQGPIIYLGCSRTWTFGPKHPLLQSRADTYPARAMIRHSNRNQHRHHWAARNASTEGRKRQCLRFKNIIAALPVYRTLRMKFLKLLVKNRIPKYPSEPVPGALTGVFFNNVFAGMRESYINDQWGHLSHLGLKFLVKNLHKEVASCSQKDISFF